MQPPRSAFAQAAVILFASLAAVPLGAQAPTSPELADSAEPPAAGASAPSPAAEGVPWSEQIVVTATRSKLAAGEAPVAATVIGREELESAPEYGLIDLLRRIPSITIFGDRSALISTPIDGGTAFRGVGGTAQARVLLMIDGVPINDPYASHLLWTRVPRGAVERIEVVPGNTGSWGNLALSGVVHLITRGAGDRTLDAEVQLGDHATRAASLFYADARDGWSGWLSGDALDSDGYHVLAPEDRGAIDEPLSKRFSNLNARLDRTFSPRTSLRVTGTLFEEYRRRGTPLTRDTNEEDALSASFDHVLDGGSTWELSAYGRDAWLEEIQPAESADRSTEVPNQRLDAPSEALGASAVWSSAGRGRHTLRAGADGQWLSIDAGTEYAWNGASYQALQRSHGRQDFFGAFVQDSWRASDRTAWTLGARFDRIRTFDGRRTTYAAGTLVEQVSFEENSETTFHPSIAVAFAPSGGLRLRGAAYTGFRAPSPSELFVDAVGRNKSVSNPELEPERLVGVEAGFDYAPSSRLATRLTAFWNESHDLIDRVEIGRAGPAGGVVEPCGLLLPSARCRQRRNIGEVRARGVELTQNLRIDERWRLQLLGALTDSRVTAYDAKPAIVGNRVVRTPREAVALSLMFDDPRWFSAVAHLRYQGERWENIENTDRLEEQFLIDLSVARDLSPRWQLSVGVQNLLDDRYIVNLSGTAPQYGTPRLLHVALRFRWR